MFINKKDLVLLNQISLYLDTIKYLNHEDVKELNLKLKLLIEKLEVKRVVKNSINSKLIAERRKTDKYYARSKKGSE